MAGRTITVVLADDTDDIRVLTRIVLERAGPFQVVGEADNGQRAIEQVATLRPDVLLLDLAMPVMDGLTAIPHVRSASPETAIIVLSGFEKGAMAEEALLLGAVAYIQKGTGKDDLVRQILDVCGVDPDEAGEEPARERARAEPAPSGASPSSPVGPGAGAARAAHELRSPLTTIIGGAQTLQQDWAALDERTRASLLEAIVRQGRRMERLVDDLLTMSRLDAGQFEVRTDDHLLRPLLGVAIATLGPIAPPVSAVVHGDPVVRADADRVVQIIENLLRNAVRYGRPPVEVEVSSAGGWVSTEVRDHGDGVPEPLVEGLFRRWSPAASGRAGSVGLGLSIVRELAEAQGGRVSYAEAPRGGARFTVVLPAAGDPPAPLSVPGG